MNPEQLKYKKLWSHYPDYRKVAPGENLALAFIELAKPNKNETCIDFGCGTGRGAALISACCKVIGIDFVDNCLDEDVNIEFKQHDLTQPLDIFPPAQYGFCTDVLEHINEKDVDKVLYNILSSARNVFFNISTVPDHFGSVIGEQLHLTVKDKDWWTEKLEIFGFKILWSTSDDNSCSFYGTGLMDGQDFQERSVLNMEMEKAKENIKKNLLLGLQEVQPYSPQHDVTVMLLAGGPSLKEYEDQIVKAGKQGVPIVTVNGTYNWLLERGVKPAAFIMVDGRDWNKRFISKHIDTCKYLMSSQCDHEFVASLPKEQTWLWHSADSEMIKEVVQDLNKPHEWFPIPGGSTVTLRALPLLVMLGFRKIEIFGWDSCLMGDAHHAYSQPENDSQTIVNIFVEDKQFKCHPWMALQAYEFQKLVKNVLGQIDDLELLVHGNGLISTMIKYAANKAEKEK